MQDRADAPDASALSKWLQFGLVALFCVVAGFYSVTIPPGEGVDEIPHFDYVRYAKENWALPVQPMNSEAGVRVWMGHHPPLYYALVALASPGLISPIGTPPSSRTHTLIGKKTMMSRARMFHALWPGWVPLAKVCPGAARHASGNGGIGCDRRICHFWRGSTPQPGRSMVGRWRYRTRVFQSLIRVYEQYYPSRHVAGSYFCAGSMVADGLFSKGERGSGSTWRAGCWQGPPP